MVAPVSAPAQQSAKVIIPGDQIAVRNGLRALFDTILLRSLPEDGRSTAEIVLAEALNNIVEHAYSSHDGEIEITLHLRQNELVCKISDTGLPMPDGKLPAGILAPLEPPADLPEGGFGWHLIRSLSKDLDYRRENGRNLLSFRLDTQQCGD
ncbi:MAG: putative anti-sigma regulatory factor serine/threonine protein kinase [Rhodobacteraceae bacterium]|uniref:ATP-binding protein n=1 Tax=Cypionkella sp. TaxID=2811411 RepID=UPI00132256A4|nr:ATP-binding protein [Cypionkella sp.]KAF0174561.1 MAG: putative anti-sigma regulatory factor serine/threonine protein kinase [Paracoccaceae bacterium]MDO8328426.1 ATP-binding protein [Cypionkella sp.]